MIGIKAYGGYVPYYRLTKATIAAAYGKSGKGGEKAVAYYDEDSVTMAAGAAMNAVPLADGSALRGVYFATTTSPYREKSCASQIAAVLDCGRELRTADFSNTLKCGSDAMLAALEACGSGDMLVAVADCRLGGNDGTYENDLGDGAAAFVMGSGDDVIARFVDACSLSMEAYDMWRDQDEKIVRYWDVRFATSEIYQPLVLDSVKGVLRKTGLTPADFSRVVCYAHEERHSTAALTKLGFTREQIQPALYGEIGNTGSAAAPLMLAAALDEAKAGEKILYVSYGDGCNAMVFETTPQIENYTPAHTIRSLIDCKDNTLPYGKYLKWKGFLLCEPQRRPEQERSSLPDYLRGSKKNNAMYGSVCTKCGTPHYPPQRVCANCRSVDEMADYRFIGKKARLRTFTLDGVALSLDSPNNLVVVEFEGGGKMMTYLVECAKEDIRAGMPVQLTFRKMFHAGGVNTYFWKVVPCRETEGM